jgi:hypothetical protein
MRCSCELQYFRQSTCCRQYQSSTSGPMQNGRFDHNQFDPNAKLSPDVHLRWHLLKAMTSTHYTLCGAAAYPLPSSSRPRMFTVSVRASQEEGSCGFRLRRVRARPQRSGAHIIPWLLTSSRCRHLVPRLRAPCAGAIVRPRQLGRFTAGKGHARSHAGGWGVAMCR